MNKEPMQPDYRIFTILSVSTVSIFALASIILMMGLVGMLFGFWSWFKYVRKKRLL